MKTIGINKILLFFLFGIFLLTSCNGQSEFPCDPYVKVSSRSTDGNSEDTVVKYIYFFNQKRPIVIDCTKTYVFYKVTTDKRKAFNTMSRMSESCFSFDDYVGEIVETGISECEALTGVSDREIVALEEVADDGTPVMPFILVRVKSVEGDKWMLDKLADEIGLVNLGLSPWDERTYMFLNNNLQTGIKTIEASNYLYENGEFEYVEAMLGYKIKHHSIPSDPLYNLQWGLTATTGINVTPAWEITKGSPDIRLAICDCSFDHSNPEFADHLFPGDSYLAYARKETINHGTYVASLAAGSHNNVGIAGVAPNVTIMDCFIGTYSDMLINIKAAIANGAQVFNCSWDIESKYDNYASFLTILKQAMTNGRDGKGCIFVFSTGNNGSTIGRPLKDLNGAIGVGAINKNGEVADFSNTGDQLSVVAPGVGIILVGNDGIQVTEDGTSFAAPHVSGLASLILSVRPDLTAAQVKQVIENTASNSIWNKRSGWGNINAGLAIRAITGHFEFVKHNGPRIVTNGGRVNYTLSGVPRGAVTIWSSSVGAKLESSNKSSATYLYTGYGIFSEVITAKITYMGRTTSVSYICNVENSATVNNVNVVNIDQIDSWIHLYADCSIPNPELEWEIVSSGSIFSIEEFIYSGDANYINTQQNYITLAYNGGAGGAISVGTSCTVKVSIKGYPDSGYIFSIKWNGDSWDIIR